MEVGKSPRPRWSYTPPAMTAPVRSRLKPDSFRKLEVNSDPRRLDDVYIAMLGEGGDKVLTEEVKWLAVTHKSFDHGRRGFNDRLAFLGKRIVELQTSLALIQTSSGSLLPQKPDPYGREPFQHQALDGLEALSEETKNAFTDKKRLANLAKQYGMPGVIRWSPKQVDNLKGSGIDLVLAQAMLAIVGAISLEKGAEAANTVVRDRILHPMGLRRQGS